MQPPLTAPAGSILDQVARAWASGQPADLAVRPTVRIGGATLAPVAIDNGNDALKGATLSPLPEAGAGQRARLSCLRTPAAFAVAQRIEGRQEVTYACDGVRFWVGEAALRHDGDALRLGPTIQRIADERQRWFIGAGIVELLRAAGYPPGAHQIALTIAVPNTEIVIERDERGGELLTLDGRTRAALAQHLKGKVWAIERRDEEGRPEEWRVGVASVLPQAQSTGTVIALTRAPNGRAIGDLDGLRVIDIGGGDLHVCEVRLSPAQMLNRRPGDGTIRIARALRAEPALGRALRNDSAAQQALVSQQITRASRRVSIAAEVERMLASKGNAIVADVLAELRDSAQFVVVTGGGALLLGVPLAEVLAQEEKVAGADYLLISGPLASQINAVGVLFGLIFRAAGKA